MPRIDPIDTEILTYKFATALVWVAIEEGIPCPDAAPQLSSMPVWPRWESVVVRRGQGTRRLEPVRGEGLLAGPAPPG